MSSRSLHLAAASIGLGLFAAGNVASANTVTITSTLPATRTINEGSALSVTWTATQSGSDIFDGWGTWSTSLGNGATGSNTFSGNRTFADEGNYVLAASVSGAFHFFFSTPFGSFPSHYSATGSSTTNVTVLNVDPTITSLTSNLSLMAGESFAFSASAFDPGVLDTLTFSWDFDSDGQYDDFVGRSGTHAYSADGLHTMGLRVTDGDGGSALGSFNVDVSGAVAAAPLPAAAWGGIALFACLGAAQARRRQRAAARQ